MSPLKTNLGYAQPGVAQTGYELYIWRAEEYGKDRPKRCNLSRNEIQDCDWLKTTFPCFLLPPLPPSPNLGWHTRPCRPPQHGAEGLLSFCVFVCNLCALASSEGRDPGYVVEVCSGYGPDKTWPAGGSSGWRYRPSRYQSTHLVLPPDWPLQMPSRIKTTASCFCSF